MTRALRAILALVVVSLWLILTVEAPATAALNATAATTAAADCTCKQGELTQQVTKADAIFLGTVTQVTATGAGYSYAITASRAYLGSPERSTQVDSLGGPKSCGLGELVVGRTYVFLANGAAAPYSADLCGGTSTANPSRITKIEGLLGEGRSVEPPPPPTAALTRVEESPPPGFARLAAPGGAAAIIGLLGLFVVRRLARR